MSTRAETSGLSLPRRRWILGGAALTGAAALAIRGGWFTRGVSAKTTATSGAPKRGGELVVAFDGTSISTFQFDPHNSGFAPHNRVMRSIYDNLTLLLPDQSVGPWLAESWEISPDRTTYLFKLKRGVEFHDGTPFDARAVKSNLDRLADPANALTSRTSLGPYQSSEVLDDHQLKVVLSQPFTPFLRNLSMTKLAVVSPAAVAKHGAVYGQHPVGTGPFRFVSLIAGNEIRLERNPDYRTSPTTAAHVGPAYLDTLVFKNVPEESTRVAVLQSGQAQAADLIPPQNLAAFKADREFKVLEKELLNTNYSLALNVSRAPWDDEEMRLALRLSLDIDTIVRVIYRGTFARAWSSLSPSMFGSAERELADSWRPDGARALEILTRKGWKPGDGGVREKGGKKLTISFIDSQGNREKRLDVIQLVRRQLAVSGIGLNIDSQPASTLAGKMANNDYDMSGGASFHADPDILRQSYTPEIRSAISGNKVVDPELIAWLKQGALEPEGEARAELYRKVQRQIIEKTYSIPIYVLLYNLAVAKRVQGVVIDAHGLPEFRDAWLES